MIINKCYLRDIKEYEENTRSNILRLFDRLNVNNIVTLLCIFIKGLDEANAYIMIDMYMDKENKNILDIFEEIRNALLGYEYKESLEDDNTDIEGTKEDVNTYEFLSDYYMHLGMQLMSLGITYTEFWSLTTKEMYQVFESIQQKMIIDFNRELQIAHITSNMNAAANWGKPYKEAPQINVNEAMGRKDEDIIINHAKYGTISLADLKSIKALEKLK